MSEQLAVLVYGVGGQYHPAPDGYTRFCEISHHGGVKANDKGISVNGIAGVDFLVGKGSGIRRRVSLKKRVVLPFVLGGGGFRGTGTAGDQ